MANRDISPQELSTARDNNLTVVLDARTGAARVVGDSQVVRDLVDATRSAQERGELKLLTGQAA